MQYWCSDVNAKFKGNIPIGAPKVNAGFVPSVCNFPPVTRISCDVYAVNGAGRSPTATSYEYTKAKGEFSNIYILHSIICFR